jgi:hypothetical protein
MNDNVAVCVGELYERSGAAESILPVSPFVDVGPVVIAPKLLVVLVGEGTEPYAIIVVRETVTFPPDEIFCKGFGAFGTTEKGADEILVVVL